MFGRGALVVLPLALLLAGAAQAQAATRYADPTGVGIACTSADPCELNLAVNGAGNADEVIVNPGTYNGQGSTALIINGTMNVHGATGQAPPQINFTSPGFSGAVRVTGTARVAQLRIDVNTQGTALTLGPATVAEGVYARTADGSGAVACSVSAALLRDSVCWAPNGVGEGVIAAGSGMDDTVTLRNVTAVGSDRGMEAFAGVADQVLTVDVKNSIFEGPDENDIELFPLGTSSDVDVVLTNSNYDTASVVDAPAGAGFVTPPGSGTNQTGAPLFVNAGIGDFRQAAGSPTLDAGVADMLGALDFEGDSRSLDATPACTGNVAVPDIGADELVATLPDCSSKPQPQPGAKKCKKKKKKKGKKRAAGAKKKKKKKCGKGKKKRK